MDFFSGCYAGSQSPNFISEEFTPRFQPSVISYHQLKDRTKDSDFWWVCNLVTCVKVYLNID